MFGMLSISFKIKRQVEMPKTPMQIYPKGQKTDIKGNPFREPIKAAKEITATKAAKTQR